MYKHIIINSMAKLHLNHNFICCYCWAWRNFYRAKIFSYDCYGISIESQYSMCCSLCAAVSWLSTWGSASVGGGCQEDKGPLLTAQEKGKNYIIYFTTVCTPIYGGGCSYLSVWVYKWLYRYCNILMVINSFFLKLRLPWVHAHVHVHVHVLSLPLPPPPLPLLFHTHNYNIHVWYCVYTLCVCVT